MKKVIKFFKIKYISLTKIRLYAKIKEKVRGERMNYEEFEEEIESIGCSNGKTFKVIEGSFHYYIMWGKKTLASVNKSTTGLINTNNQDFEALEEKIRLKLLDIIYKFARTPIEERGYSE